MQLQPAGEIRRFWSNARKARRKVVIVVMGKTYVDVPGNREHGHGKTDAWWRAPTRTNTGWLMAKGEVAGSSRQARAATSAQGQQGNLTSRRAGKYPQGKARRCVVYGRPKADCSMATHIVAGARLPQLVEERPFKPSVGGSSPSSIYKPKSWPRCH